MGEYICRGVGRCEGGGEGGDVKEEGRGKCEGGGEGEV